MQFLWRISHGSLYCKSKSNEPTNECPSFIGYGICEEPLPTEMNTAEFCGKKAYWQYSFLTNVVPQYNKKNFIGFMVVGRSGTTIIYMFN
jgi:hypothetical protein